MFLNVVGHLLLHPVWKSLEPFVKRELQSSKHPSNQTNLTYIRVRDNSIIDAFGFTTSLGENIIRTSFRLQWTIRLWKLIIQQYRCQTNFKRDPRPS